MLVEARQEMQQPPGVVRHMLKAAALIQTHLGFFIERLERY